MRPSKVTLTSTKPSGPLRSVGDLVNIQISHFLREEDFKLILATLSVIVILVPLHAEFISATFVSYSMCFKLNVTLHMNEKNVCRRLVIFNYIFSKLQIRFLMSILSSPIPNFIISMFSSRGTQLINPPIHKAKPCLRRIGPKLHYFCSI